MSDRPVPQDASAERAVLGALMLSPRRMPLTVDRLDAETFYEPINRTLWEHMAAAHKDGHGLDPVALWTWINMHPIGNNNGLTPVYLAETTEAVATIDSALALIPALIDLRRRRKLIQLGESVSQHAYAADSDLDELERLFRRGMADEGPVVDSWTTPGAEWGNLLARMTTPAAPEDPRIVPSPWPSLNRVLNGGIRPKQLVIVGARPSAGKSLVLLDWARHAVFYSPAVVAFFSMEMGVDEVINRLGGGQHGIRLDAINDGNVPQGKIQEFTGAIDSWESAGLCIEDRTRLTITQIGAMSRRIKARRGRLDLICVDYLGLITPEGRYDPSKRRHYIEEWTRELKILSGELECPVLLAAQLNRDSDRENRPPSLRDLRESGGIEQDANTVILLNPEMIEDVPTGFVEAIVAKHRGGAKGKAGLEMQGHYGRFVDAA